MIKKYYIYFLILVNSIISTEIYNYKISFWGLVIADCQYSIKDTIIYNKESIKLNYMVKTNKLYDLFFKVSNNYSVVFDKSNYRTLYYTKRSSQPKIYNKIKTEYINDIVKYSDSLIIDLNEINIFTLLYLQSNYKNKEIEKYDIIDSEGKKYNYNLNKVNENEFILNLNAVEKNKYGAIKDTDIFTWALSLPNTESYFYINKQNNVIDYCEFSKGFLKLKGKRIK